VTVAELIAKLQQLPQDLPVTTGGFDEDDYDYLETVKVVRLREVDSPGSHSGAFDEAEGERGMYRRPLKGEPFDAVYLDR